MLLANLSNISRLVQRSSWIQVWLLYRVQNVYEAHVSNYSRPDIFVEIEKSDAWSALTHTSIPGPHTQGSLSHTKSTHPPHQNQNVWGNQTSGHEASCAVFAVYRPIFYSSPGSVFTKGRDVNTVQLYSVQQWFWPELTIHHQQRRHSMC